MEGPGDVTHRRSLWAVGPMAVGGALVATLALRWVAVALLDIPPEFPPLAGPGPTIFFTVVLGSIAVGVFGLLRARAKRPDRLFRAIALVSLLLSFLPDVWLLSDGAAEAIPGATPTAVVVLMVMHVAAAVAIVWVLTRAPRGPSP